MYSSEVQAQKRSIFLNPPVVECTDNFVLPADTLISEFIIILCIQSINFGCEEVNTACQRCANNLRVCQCVLDIFPGCIIMLLIQMDSRPSIQCRTAKLGIIDREGKVNSLICKVEGFIGFLVLLDDAGQELVEPTEQVNPLFSLRDRSTCNDLLKLLDVLVKTIRHIWRNTFVINAFIAKGEQLFIQSIRVFL